MLSDELSLAASHGHLLLKDKQNVIDSLELRDGDEYTMLESSIMNGMVSNVFYLIECGANVNSIDEFGRSLLYYAVYYEHYYIARMLLHAGSHPDVADSDNETPLFCALLGQQDDFVKLLIDYGASVKNVRLSKTHVECIPRWVTRYVEAREYVRKAALLMVGIHKHGGIPTGQDVNVLRMIGKHIWSTRTDERWERKRIRNVRKL